MKHDIAEAIKKLDSIHQQHLLNHWNSLSEPSKESLLEQIHLLDVPVFLEQRKLVFENPTKQSLSLQPFQEYDTKILPQDRQKGEELISEGKVGCLIVAGGQGTRLRFNGPKGMFPITVIKHKSLFQLFAEKVLAAGKKYGKSLPVAIMTSPLNHVDTLNFFERHHHFGLNKKDISFFSQAKLPFLTEEGNTFLEKNDLIAEGPDGNGSALKHFVEKGIWTDWSTLGIEYVNFILIDNPLADPFDAGLIGYHHRKKSDITIKCILREDPHEKVGVIVKEDSKVCVREYTELQKEEMEAREKDGTLKHPCANISLFCLSIPFIYDAAMLYYPQMPFHKALKSANFLANEGKTKMSEKPFAWKFEKYIFDILPYAKKIGALLYRREECFAPLKNEIGADSPTEVQKSLLIHDRKCFENISGTSVNASEPFELDPQFYYPTEELQAAWKGKQLPATSYIHH